MLLVPKRWKYRKQMVPVLRGKASRWTSIAFGEFGLKATTSGYLSNRQLEAARKVVVRHTRKIGKIWFRVFPDVPFTKKGLEMPMGKGKGDVDIFKAPVKKGTIILEITGLDREKAEKVLTSASKKLSVKTKVLGKGDIY